MVLRAALKSSSKFLVCADSLSHARPHRCPGKSQSEVLLFLNSQAVNMSFSLAWPSRACGAPLFWSRAAASWLAVPEVFCELPQLPFSLLRTVCLPCTSSSWGSIGVERKKERERVRERERERERERKRAFW